MTTPTSTNEPSDSPMSPRNWRNIAAQFMGHPFIEHDGVALATALAELDRLRPVLAAHEADEALYARVLREVPWLGAWPSIYGTWPPTWLVELAEQGHADAIQADRATVTSTKNLGSVPAVPWRPGTPWYRHSVPPRPHDPDAYASACRVLAACKGDMP